MCNNEAKLVYLNGFKNKHMKYTTGLQNIEFYAFHGVYPEEQIIGGRFIVDITITRYLPHGKLITQLDEALNYELIYSILNTEMLQPQLLLETVAQRIIKQITSEFQSAIYADIKIRKPRAGGLLPNGEAVVYMQWSTDDK